MKEKKGFGDQLEAFFEGKGFYIVLFLCAAVIGVSAWTLVAGTDVETRINDIEAAGIVVTPGAAASAAPIINFFSIFHSIDEKGLRNAPGSSRCLSD